MNYRRQWSVSNLAEKFNFITFGKIGWGMLGLLLLICFLGYILIIKEIKITFIGPIPWISIITQPGKSYLTFFMDLTNDFLRFFNLKPIFTGKNGF